MRSGKTVLATAGIAVIGATSVTIGAVQAAAPKVTATDQSKLQTIISKGDAEITRRLTSLQTLQGKFGSMTKLSASDKAYLSAEVSGEVSGLTNLKAKLDAETTLSGARADAKDIFTGYRVYALVLPKTWLVKTADDQQSAEDRLTALMQKLQTKVNAAKSQGKDVTALQNDITDMQTQLANARGISSGMETKVLTLQPSDYNADHALLSGDSAQLKQAHADNKAALDDAKKIEAGLKVLK